MPTLADIISAVESFKRATGSTLEDIAKNGLLGLRTWREGYEKPYNPINYNRKDLVNDLNSVMLRDIAMNMLIGNNSEDVFGGQLSGAQAAAPIAKRAASNIKKSSTAGVFDNVLTEPEAMALARQGVHLKQSASGQYVGAPRGVDSPPKLGSMRSTVDAKVQAGDFNADWYDRAREAIDAASLGPVEARLLSRGGAAYSPQATPPMETNAFFSQHNPMVVSGEFNFPRTRSQGVNISNAYELDPATGGYRLNPDAIKLGKKTGPYSDAKDPTIPDVELFKTANDIWHGRVFGYTNNDGSTFSRGFTPQEHGFLTGENLLMADRATRRGLPVGDLGTTVPWTPRRGQAATWGAERFNQLSQEWDDKIAKATKDRAKWDRAKAKGKQEGSRPSIPTKPSDEELKAQAALGVDDAMKRHVGSDTYEWTPGVNTGHAAGFSDLPEAERQAFAEGMQKAYAPSGRDPIYDALQMYQNPTATAQGQYLNSQGVVEHNPAFVAQPMIDLKASTLSKGKGGPEVGDAGRRAMDFAGTLRAILGNQEAGAWNKFTRANSSMKGFEKTGGRLESDPETLRVANELFGNAGLDTVNVGNALHVGQFPPEVGPATPGKVIQKRISNVLKNNPINGDLDVGRLETQYLPIPWGQEGSGDVTRMLVSQLARPDIRNAGQRLDAAGLPKTVADMTAFENEFFGPRGIGQRADIQKLRALLSDPGVGFSGLQDYVKKYGYAGLPSLAALALFGPELLGGAPPEQ